MPLQHACPDLAGWSALLDEPMGPEDEQRLERHLATCRPCRECLDEPLASGDSLLTLARQFGDPTRVAVDPTLADVVRRLQDAWETRGDAEDDLPELSFLRPASKPGVLGMLGVYEVRALVGQGGTGIVLKAYEPALQRLVAIKVLAARLSGNVIARFRFRREAQAAAAVCHDHIVPVYAVNETDGVPYLVMQYVAGESLQARLDRTGPLKPIEVVRIGMQTAAGLAAAHAQGLIHRDVKPANLLLEHGLARVKITDFGLARMADDVQLTQSGVVLGTPDYMAPEQARGETLDHRADLFSLGSVLYALCAGAPPFRGSTTLSVLRKVCDEPPPALRQLNPNVPAWLDTLIARLMAKDPTQRFQSAAEVACLLEGYLAHLRQPETAPAPRLPTTKTENRRSRRFLARAALAVCLTSLLATIGTWLLLQGNDGADKQDANPGPAKAARQRAVFDLKKGLGEYSALTLERPNVPGVVKEEPQGIRVTFPDKRQDTRPVRLELRQPVRGDFDIVLDGEVLAVGNPIPKYGAGVGLHLYFDSPNTAVISMRRKPQGDLFSAHRIVKQDDDKKKYLDNKDGKATRLKAKLRLQRTGTLLRYSAAEEGQDDKHLQTVNIGAADIMKVSVEVDTMFNPIALDARLTELVVEADEFPTGNPVTQPVSDTPDPTLGKSTGRRGWLFAGVAIGLALLLAFALTGAYVIVRRRKKPTLPAPTLPAPAGGVLTCPGCGKKIRVPATAVGRRIKCPHCRQTTTVPQSDEGKSAAP